MHVYQYATYTFSEFGHNISTVHLLEQGVVIAVGVHARCLLKETVGNIALLENNTLTVAVRRIPRPCEIRKAYGTNATIIEGNVQ